MANPFFKETAASDKLTSSSVALIKPGQGWGGLFFDLRRDLQKAFDLVNLAILAGGGGGGGGALVYQPGGTAGGNVYTDPWELYTAMIAAGLNNGSAIVHVFVDCTYQSPAPWPIDQLIYGAVFHAAPGTSAPAVLGTVNGTNPNTAGPSLGALYVPAELDGVLVVNVNSTSEFMVYVGAEFSPRFSLRNNAGIQRAGDFDNLALGIFPNPDFTLYIDKCNNPFPNLMDGGAWNTQVIGGTGSTLNVVVTEALPTDATHPFQMPSFSAGPGPVLNVFYDDTVPASALNEGAWQGTVNLFPLAQGGMVPGLWFVDISGRLGGPAPVGDGSFNNPFNLIQSALNAIMAADAAARLPGGFGYSGYEVRITEGYSNESLSMGPLSLANNIRIRGSGSNATNIGAQSGPSFFWQLGATPMGSYPPSNISFEDIGFNTQDLVSNTVHLDGSAAASQEGAFSDVCFLNCNINNAGGNPSGTGVPLYIKSAQVNFISSAGNGVGVNANGTGPSVRVWNGQLSVSGPNAGIGSVIQFCADYRPGAPPTANGLCSVQVSNGASINGVQAQGTPVIFVPDSGTCNYIESYPLDTDVSTAFENITVPNRGAPWVGATLVNTLGPGAVNIGPIVGVQGLLGSVFGPGNASQVQFPDMTAFPAPMLGPAFFCLGGGTIAGALAVETADPAGLVVDWGGAKLFGNLFNGAGASVITAGDGVTVDLRGASYANSTLAPVGTGKFITGVGYWEVHVWGSYSGVSDGSYAHPYTTIQAGINAAIALGVANAAIIVHAGTYNENLVINNYNGGLYLAAFQPTPKDSQNIVVTGNLTISGTATHVRVKDIKFAYPGGTQPDLIDSSAGRNYFSNVGFEGGGGIQFTGAWARWHEFTDCTISGPVSIGGAPAANSQVSMWRTRGGATITQSTVNCALLLVDTEGLGLLTHAAGKVTIEGGFCPSIVSTTNSGTDSLTISHCTLYQGGAAFGTINKTGTCPYALSSVWRNPSLDTLTGPTPVIGALGWNSVTPVDGATVTAHSADWISYTANLVATNVINLPDATLGFPRVRITKGGTGSLQVFTSGGQNIYNVVNGATPNFFMGDYQSVTLESDGTQWWRVA
jgi:hypothetical protein